MKMIRAFIRPERSRTWFWRWRVRVSHHSPRCLCWPGQAEGLTVGPVHYDELPKTLIMTVVDDKDIDKVLKVIQDKARTGFIGDGKIFVSPVDMAYTVRTGEAAL